MEPSKDLPFRCPTTGKRFSKLSDLRNHLELGHSHLSAKNELHSNNNDKPTNVSSSYLWDLYSTETNKLESIVLKQKEKDVDGKKFSWNIFDSIWTFFQKVYYPMRIFVGISEHF